MSDVIFVDTETTGLDPDRHEIWEVALITDNEVVEYHFSVDLRRADPSALRVGRFYERRHQVAPMADDLASIVRYRYDGDGDFKAGLDRSYHAGRIAERLDGKHLVGAVPSFDAAFLTKFLNRHGHAATWHYHLIDVEALAVGYLYGSNAPMSGILPWDSETLSRAVGVDPDDFDRHTARGDAEWAKAIYEAVMG